jgi:hypothetical protein
MRPSSIEYSILKRYTVLVCIYTVLNECFMRRRDVYAVVDTNVEGKARILRILTTISSTDHY